MMLESATTTTTRLERVRITQSLPLYEFDSAADDLAAQGIARLTARVPLLQITEAGHETGLAAPGVFRRYRRGGTRFSGCSLSGRGPSARAAAGSAARHG